MRNLLIIFLLPLFFSSCEDKIQLNDTYLYEVYTNYSIDLDSSNTELTLVPADKKVFYYRKDVNREKSNDIRYEELFFAIDDKTLEFEAIDEEIKQLNCYFYQGVKLPEGYSIPFVTVEKGKITGKKLANNKWEIHALITISPTEKIEIQSTFNEVELKEKDFKRPKSF